MKTLHIDSYKVPTVVCPCLQFCVGLTHVGTLIFVLIRGIFEHYVFFNFCMFSTEILLITVGDCVAHSMEGNGSKGVPKSSWFF